MFIATSLGSSDVGFATKLLYPEGDYHRRWASSAKRSVNYWLFGRWLVQDYKFQLSKTKRTTSFQSGKNIYIQEGQSPAEQRFGLNLMINVMSQNTDKYFDFFSLFTPFFLKFTPFSWSKCAWNRWSSSDYADKRGAQQLITLWEAWNSDEISLKDY